MNIGGIAARCRLCELLIQPLIIQTPKTAKLVDQRRSSEAFVEVLLRQQSAELHVPVVIHLVVPVVTGNGCDQTQGSCIREVHFAYVLQEVLSNGPRQLQVVKILEQVRLEGTALQPRRRLQLEVLPPDPLRFARKVLGDEVRRVDNQPELRVVDQDEELAVVGAICNGKRWSMN